MKTPLRDSHVQRRGGKGHGRNTDMYVRGVARCCSSRWVAGKGRWSGEPSSVLARRSELPGTVIHTYSCQTIDLNARSPATVEQTRPRSTVAGSGTETLFRYLYLLIVDRRRSDKRKIKVNDDVYATSLGRFATNTITAHRSLQSSIGALSSERWWRTSKPSEICS
jgi:hypothetical protein